MKEIKEINDLRDKKIFLRVDFNVPIQKSNEFLNSGANFSLSSFRIKVHKKTIDFLVSRNAKVALISHFSDSFKKILKKIGEILNYDLDFEENILNPKLKNQLTLFENIRKYKEEEENDQNFAKNLAKNFDIYVNDAFSVSHRNHSSISGVPKFLPSYAGFNLIKETLNLKKTIEEPKEGKIVVLGGAKISTKLPVIKNFLDKAEKILIGGALANVIFKLKGIKVGKSLVENSGIEEILKEIDFTNSQIVLPDDLVISENENILPRISLVRDLEEEEKILDIGPQTAEKFSKIISKSKVIIFNGPLGFAEIENFSLGTRIVLDSIARSNSFSVIGGGDTLALLEKYDLLNKYSFVSTGGGAMLEFLGGEKLPGLEALNYYK